MTHSLTLFPTTPPQLDHATDHQRSVIDPLTISDQSSSLRCVKMVMGMDVGGGVSTDVLKITINQRTIFTCRCLHHRCRCRPLTIHYQQEIHQVRSVAYPDAYPFPGAVRCHMTGTVSEG